MSGSPYQDYIYVPRIDKFPPEYNLINNDRYQMVQAFIDHNEDSPSEVYYIFYDKMEPSNTTLLTHEDQLNSDYYKHISETVDIIKTEWKNRTGNEIGPEVDLYKLLQLNIEQHIERAKILSAHHY